MISKGQFQNVRESPRNIWLNCFEWNANIYDPNNIVIARRHDVLEAGEEDLIPNGNIVSAGEINRESIYRIYRYETLMHKGKQLGI